MDKKDLTEDQLRWAKIWESLDTVTEHQKFIDVKFIEIVKCPDTDKAEQLTENLMDYLNR